MTYVYKGRGFIQTTGKYSMSNVSLNNVYATQTHVAAINSQSSGINLNHLTPISISSLNSNHSPYVKKYELIETTEDLLVLSCVWYRLRNEQKNKSPSQSIPGLASFNNVVNKLTDNVLFENIKSEDRELSTKIRDYYSKKMMMLKLKDVRLTQYREDLNNFIHSDGTKFKENMCGLVFRLPEFYEYDNNFDKLTNQCEREISNKESFIYRKHVLTHLGTSNLNRKARKLTEYWFKNENNNLVNINLDPTNPLMKIWDSLIEKDITIVGNYYLKTRDNIEYFSIKNYSIEKG